MCYELYNKPWRFYILLASVTRKLMTSFSKQRPLRVVEGGSVIPLYWQQQWRDANCTIEGIPGLPTSFRLSICHRVSSYAEAIKHILFSTGNSWPRTCFH